MTGSRPSALAGILCAGLMVQASLAAERHRPPSVEAIVLTEIHVTAGWSAVDTVSTYITPGRVRVSYASGDAILDVPGNRFVLLDRVTSTYRALNLRDWEARLSEARAPSDSAENVPPQAQFEFEGDGGEIAGYRCQRYHLYARREMLPGDVDMVEQEIWVTRELELPGAAYAAYRRAVESLERLGLDPRIRRPPGVVLRAQTHTRPEGGGEDQEETESTDVVRVEKRTLPAGWFDIPAGYAPLSDSTATGP